MVLFSPLVGDIGEDAVAAEAAPVLPSLVTKNNAIGNSAFGAGEDVEKTTPVLPNLVIKNNAIEDSEFGVGEDVVETAVETAPILPNLIIRNNTIEDSGFGIYLGWGGNWITEISSNRIADNGEGIRIVNAYTTIDSNIIENNITGVRVTAEHQGEKVTEVLAVSLFRNTITGNLMYGLENLAPLTVEACGNWWGDAAGPRLNAGQTGKVGQTANSADRIFGAVEYIDWQKEPFLTSVP